MIAKWKGLALGFLRNLREVLRVIPPMRFDLARIDASAAQVALSIGLWLIAYVAYEAWTTWPIGGVESYAVLATMATAFGSIAALGIGALVVFRGHLAAKLIVAVMLIAVPAQIAGNMVITNSVGLDARTLIVLYLTVVIVPPVLVVLRGLGTRSLFGVFRGLPTLVIYVGISAWIISLVPPGYLFLPAGYDDVADGPDYNPVDVEKVYYAQPQLMADQVQGLQSQAPGTGDLYAVLGAGTAYQSVFLSEIEQVHALVAAQYDARDRTIMLANSAPNPERYPMLNRHNLSSALMAIGAAMDPAEDIAFLFLTSHGSEDSLSLGFYEAGLDSISAADLAGYLDKSGIRTAVIVISACHSGSFIDELAGPTRMVVTASAADRNSFGCADGVDWTDFGRAYFDLALRDNRDFRAAFRTASLTVSEWEQEGGQIPSLPQISVGVDFDAIIDRFLSVDVTSNQ